MVEQTPGRDRLSNEVNLRDISHREGTAAAELRRIQSSPSFRLGVLFIRAIERPIRILRLPWDLLVLVWNIFRESRETESEDPEDGLRRCILFISGESDDDHRQERIISLASDINEVESSVELVHLTLGPPIEFGRPAELREYSLPSSRESDKIWGGLLSEQVSLLLAAYRPTLVVFDGEYPHRGLIRALGERSEHICVWIQPGVDSAENNLTTEGGVFHHILAPQEPFDVSATSQASGVTSIKPFFSTDREQRSAARARSALDIQREAIVVYHQPPAASSKHQQNVFQSLLDCLCESDAILVLPSGKKYRMPSYPRALVRRLPTPFSGSWRSAFDMAIIDGSHTSILKTLHSEIPTISVPRLGVRDDVERLRAEAAHNAGCAIMIVDLDETSPAWIVRRMLNPLKRRRMRAACRLIPVGDGLTFLREWLLSQLND